MVKRVAPPATDEQLALAEHTDIVRRRDRQAAIDDEQEQERLAAAGEPESESILALRAGASVLNSRPNRSQEPDDDETTDGAGVADDERATKSSDKVAAQPRQQRRSSKQRNGDSSRRETPPAPQAQEPDPEETEKQQDERAYKLMDMAYRKWGVAAKKDLRKANRELAIDLGKDTALYLRSGIIRLADLHAAIDRLTAVKAGEREHDEDGENFDDELETMRAALRDGK